MHIRNVSAGTDAVGFDKYAGAITGGPNVAGNKTLLLDKVTIDKFNASLSDFSHVTLVNGTATQLTSLGGAHTLNIGDGCSLVLDAESGLLNLVMGENSSLSIDGFTADKVIVDITGVNDYTISLTQLPANVDNILFMDGDDFYASEIRNIDLQANSGQLFAVVPEPSTATLSMLGLASLLMRRRRKA